MADEKPGLDEELNAAEPVGAEADLDVEHETEVQSDEIQPPVIPPPLTHEVQEHEGRRWPVIAGYLVAALAVAAIIVFGARAIYHAAHHKSNPNPTPGNGLPAIPKSSSSSSKKTSSSSHKPASSSSSTATVPNTGPGNTIGLFAAITIAAAGLHYVYSIRRQTEK